MAYAFDKWCAMSDSFTSSAGARLTAIPWGDHFALFAADNYGRVWCAGGDPQNDLMGPWVTVSDGFAGVNGASVTARPWGDRFALFAFDSRGAVCCAGGDPQNGLMGPWVPISDGFSGDPYGVVTVGPWGDGFALFATDDTNAVWCAAGDPQNGLTRPWRSISRGLDAQAGGAVTAARWESGFALFVTDSSRTVWCGGADPQNGLTAPWRSISQGFSGIAGASVAAVPWSGTFALFATDDAGSVRVAAGDPHSGLTTPWAEAVAGIHAIWGTEVGATTFGLGVAFCVADTTPSVRIASGDPHTGFTEWTPVDGDVSVAQQTPVTIVAVGEGVDVFAITDTGQAMGTGGGLRAMTEFTPGRHGWHFDNEFVNQLPDGITTKGLCGGMAYTSLDYYHCGIPIPTHRVGDFVPAAQRYPSPGRLHDMILERLIDSFVDNYAKWSCAVPNLAHAITVAGWLLRADAPPQHYGCPDGGSHAITQKEVPQLINQYLDAGLPAPIGLIYDGSIFDIGESHQVVAYGHAIVGNKTVVYVYDNRFHDAECILTFDTVSPATIVETYADRTPLPATETTRWQGLLVEDGYQIHQPSYGFDIGVSGPQVVSMTGYTEQPVVADPPHPVRLAARAEAPTVAESPTVSAAPAEAPTQAPVAVERRLPVGGQDVAPIAGHRLGDTFTVRNYGEFPAHYLALGISVLAPDGSVAYVMYPAPADDNPLGIDFDQLVSLEIDGFGPVRGDYVLRPGYKSVAENAESSQWMELVDPGVTVKAG